jgi:cation diffusion facilitator family transporter
MERQLTLYYADGMQKRTRSIVGVLVASLCGAFTVSILKIWYGGVSDNLAFIADGIHSLFDFASTAIGIVTLILASKPPDEDHPYGHQKFEGVAAVLLAVLLTFAAYEVGAMAYQRFIHPTVFPTSSFWGLAILGFTMVLNLGIAKFEHAKAKELGSSFLKSDAMHNQSDFWTSLAVLISLISGRYRIPYVDALASIVITVYLVHVALRLINMNIHPLVDRSVVDAKKVEEIARSIPEVIHCHDIRSRGDENHFFLDLSLHLPGKITLEHAHEITHHVEEALKKNFPGLRDVVIHTEPDGHIPCR